MPPSDDVFLTEWHRIVTEKDLDALARTLAPDVTLGAPPYWAKLAGRELVTHLLGLILDTIEDFRYRREWRDGDELALEFTGHVGDTELQAIDLITRNERGEVQNIDVLMRPEGAIAELRQRIAPKMTSYLASRS
jgi:hypothetical protein